MPIWPLLGEDNTQRYPLKTVCDEKSMLNNTTAGTTRVTVKQLGLKADNLPEKVVLAGRDYYFWYYLLERPMANFNGAVYLSEPDALLFVTVKEPT